MRDAGDAGGLASPASRDCTQAARTRPLMPDVEVRFISADETRPLRAAILRPGQSPETLIYPGDDADETAHFGAYRGGELIGIASVYREPVPRENGSGEDDPNAWRLRGMATITSMRGRGYGRMILEKCVEHVAREGGTVLWCNARTTAAGFYETLGFHIIGHEFDIPGIGAHFVMLRRTS